MNLRVFSTLPSAPSAGRARSEMPWGNEVHDTIADRINKATPLPESMPYEHLVAPLVQYGAVAEKKLGMTKEGRPCDFFADDVFLRGKLDAPIVAGDQALLVDW